MEAVEGTEYCLELESLNLFKTSEKLFMYRSESGQCALPMTSQLLVVRKDVFAVLQEIL